MPENLSPELLNYLTVINKLPKKGYKYCIKTGKSLYPISCNEIMNMIQIHGINRSLVICMQMQKSIAAEWLLTDDVGLRRLAGKEPVEYFIYAITHLIPVFLGKEKDIDRLNTGHLCLDRELTIKIVANEFLHTIPLPQLLQISELTRLILGNNRPVTMQEMFQTFSLSEICKSIDNLNKFNLILKACYEQIKCGYYDDGIVDARKRQKKNLFAKQKTLIVRNELEKLIADSLEDIEIDRLINPDGFSDEYMGSKMSKDAKRLKIRVEKDRVIKGRLDIERKKIQQSAQKFTGIKWGKV